MLRPLLILLATFTLVFLPQAAAAKKGGKGGGPAGKARSFGNALDRKLKADGFAAPQKKKPKKAPPPPQSRPLPPPVSKPKAKPGKAVGHDKASNPGKALGHDKNSRPGLGLGRNKESRPGLGLGRDKWLHEHRKHLKRIARLDRIMTLAHAANDAGMQKRVNEIIAKEKARHQRVTARLSK